MSCLAGTFVLFIFGETKGTILVSGLLTEMQRVEMDLLEGLICLGREIR